jgi:hypothetical protein
VVDTPGHSEIDTVTSYVGGLRWTGGNVTFPLARLELRHVGIRVLPSIRALSGIVPEWEIPWEESSAQKLSERCEFPVEYAFTSHPTQDSYSGTVNRPRFSTILRVERFRLTTPSIAWAYSGRDRILSGHNRPWLAH